MPVLILARHAHATHDGGPDFERPLTDEGRAEAVRAGTFLAAYPLDCVVTSEAVRAVQTAQGIVEQHPASPVVRTDGALYAARVRDWYEAIATVPHDARGALIVGHMPVVAEAVEELSGVRIDRFRPSSVAVFELDSWENFARPAEVSVLRDFVER